MQPPADRAMAKAGDVPDCPYKGLTPYTERDAAYFFGRDRDRGLVVANLRASRLTLLYGPSGVGKSSLLQAGVLRQLHDLSGNSRAPSGMRPVIAAYHASWRDDPLVGLAAALRDALPNQLPDQLVADDLVPANVSLSVELLRHVTTQLNANVVLVCDQFEEVTVYQTGTAADTFAAELGRIIAATDVRVAVLIGIREDALARLDRFEEDIPVLFDNLLRLDPLDLTAARHAIEQPVLRYNTEVPADRQVSIEAELVDELLPRLRTGSVSVVEAGRGDVERADVDDASATIETPFLQLVMTRLWSEEAARGSRTLRRSTLDELGGAEQIVRTHLDAVMSQLSDDQQEVAARTFRYLVTRSGMKIAYTAEDLADCAGIEDRARVTDVLERLSAGRERVLRPVPAPVGQPGAPRYEIFHDVMAPAVLDWRRRHIEVRDRAESERKLVQAEERDRETRRQLRQSRLLSATLALLLVAVLGLVYLNKRSLDYAQYRERLAVYERLSQSDPVASLRAALQAWQKRHSPEAQTAVRMALSRPLSSMALTAGAHSGAVWSAEMSPREDLIVAAYQDGQARLWDARTGDTRHVLDVGKGAASARFSADGSIVVASAQDGHVRVFDSRTGSFLAALGHYVEAPVVEPGRVGTRNVVLTWAYNENPIVWDARTGKILARLGVEARSASLSSDGTRVVVGATDGRLRVWSWMGRGRVVVDSAPHTYSDFLEARFSSSDPSLVLAIDRGTGNLIGWKWNSARPSRTLVTSQFSDEPNAITESSSAGLVAVTAGKEVGFFQTATGRLRHYLPDSADYVEKLAFDQDGRYLAEGDADGTIRLFVVRNGWVNPSPLAVLAGNPGAVTALAFSRNGRTLLSASADGSIRLWPLPDRVVLLRSTERIVDARISADGRIVVSGDYYRINVSDTRASGPGRSFTWFDEQPDQQLMTLALSPDNSYVVATASSSIEPLVYDLSTGGRRAIRFNRRPINGQKDVYRYLTAVDHTPRRGQHWIALGNDGGGVEMLDVRTGALRWSRQISQTPGEVLGVRFSADGSKVVTAGSDGASILDAASGRILRTFKHSTPVSAVAVTTDGDYLATYAFDRRLRIWSTEDSTGRPVSEVPMPAPANRLAFSPDRRSRFLAVAASDGTTIMYSWHTPPLSVFSTGKPRLTFLATFKEHLGSVNAVEFDTSRGVTGEAPRLISAGDDGTLLRYRCDLCTVADSRLEQYAENQLAR